MATAYKELEQKQSGAPAPAAAPPVPPTPGAPAADAFDLKAAAAEYDSTQGQLSTSTVAAMTKHNVTLDAVKEYVEGAKAVAAAIVADVTASAGGPENLKSVYTWAKANLSADEIVAYDNIVTNGGRVAAKMAFDGLFSRYTKATGTAPQRVAALGAPASTGPAPFASNEQVVEAMRNPKYKTDEAYRQEVAKRLSVSKMFAGKR
jgi:hypothetical protein